MSQTKITRRNRLGLILKLLIGVGLLLFTIAIFVGIPGVADLPRTAYNYSRRSPVTIMWNGVEFSLPPPWFRLGQNEQIKGTVTFFRDQFPWAERQFSLITFKPPFPNDFAANPENGLQRWEQLNQSLWSIPNTDPRLISYSYSTTHGTNNDFRCANTISDLRGERLRKIECIETRLGGKLNGAIQSRRNRTSTLLAHGF